MAQNSTIEWTEATWNPVTGCTKVSPGCKNCYAERMAHRLRAMEVPAYEHGFELTLQPQTLLAPLKWRKPRMIFVNSMSDLFHRAVPTDYIIRVMEVIRAAHWHQFQILTKRSERLAGLDREVHWPSNLWLGVSVESHSYAWRIDDLRRVRASVRFLSLEPLLGPIEGMNLDGIHWVIAGGESGPRARPVDPAWIIEIRDQCLS
ncbi:MAG: phage Gp37/Gp68 family protein, partial [Thermoanaerobaculia bacterium]